MLRTIAYRYHRLPYNVFSYLVSYSTVKELTYLTIPKKCYSVKQHRQNGSQDLLHDYLDIYCVRRQPLGTREASVKLSWKMEVLPRSEHIAFLWTNCNALSLYDYIMEPVQGHDLVYLCVLQKGLLPLFPHHMQSLTLQNHVVIYCFHLCQSYLYRYVQAKSSVSSCTSISAITFEQRVLESPFIQLCCQQYLVVNMNERLQGIQ